MIPIFVRAAARGRVYTSTTSQPTPFSISERVTESSIKPLLDYLIINVLDRDVGHDRDLGHVISLGTGENTSHTTRPIATN